MVQTQFSQIEIQEILYVYIKFYTDRKKDKKKGIPAVLKFSKYEKVL